MRRVVLMAVGLSLITSAALAQSNQVLSRNAVGYVKVDALSNKLVLARMDFENLSGSSWTVTNLLGSQLPVGSIVTIWDRVNYRYVGEARTRSGWSPGTNVIRRGDAFFVRSLAATNMYFMGEVPDSISAPDTVFPNVTGLSALGYPYPVSQPWTNIALSTNGAIGDILTIWDAVNQQYIGYARTRSGWGAATNLVLQPGQAFWYRSAVTQTWTVVKPYTWP